MCFGEVRVFKAREVLRLWLPGEGLRSIEHLAGIDRKTVPRYVAAAVPGRTVPPRPSSSGGRARDRGRTVEDAELAASSWVRSYNTGSRRLHAGHRLARTQAPARLIEGARLGPPVSMPPDY